MSGVLISEPSKVGSRDNSSQADSIAKSSKAFSEKSSRSNGLQASIYLLREEAGFEYHFPALVSLDRDGDIESVVGEDVPEKYWTRRYGAPEPEFTGANLFSEGADIELFEEEEQDARAAIEGLSRAWSEEITKLKMIFRRDA